MKSFAPVLLAANDRQQRMDVLLQTVNLVRTANDRFGPLMGGMQLDDIVDGQFDMVPGAAFLLMPGESPETMTKDKGELIESPRSIPSKFGLKLAGISVVVKKFFSKSEIKRDMAAEREARKAAGEKVGRAPSMTSYFRKNRSKYTTGTDVRKFFVDRQLLRSTKGYMSLPEESRQKIEAVFNGFETIPGSAKDSVMRFNGKLPKEHEAEIDKFLYQINGLSKASSKELLSTVRFMVKARVVAQIGDIVASNRSRKSGDPGWAIPPIVSITSGSSLSVKFQKLGWELEGELESTENLSKEERARTIARNERIKKRNRAKATSSIVDSVKELREKAKNGDKDAQFILAQETWYTSTYDRLVRGFGPYQILFTELLAALSPRTPADTNFIYAVDAIKSFIKGDYDKVLEQYADWVSDETRIRKVEQLDMAISERTKALARENSDRDVQVAPMNDPQLNALKAERSSATTYTGPTVFRDVVVVQGEPFPSDAVETANAEVKTPATRQVFRTMENLKSKYGPKLADFEGDIDAHAEAMLEFESRTRINNPSAFAEDGSIVPGASLSVPRLFGINSMAAMNVMAGLWAKNVRSPKVHTFFANLAGFSNNATIDVWMGRAIRSALGMPRIPYFAETAIQGSLEGGDIDMARGEYAFGQSILNDAAQQLGMSPMNMQALLWFMEKQSWSKSGWTSSQGAGGSFERTYDRLGIAMSEIEIPEDADPSGELVDGLISDLNNDKNVVVSAYSPSMSVRSGRKTGITLVVKSGFDMPSLHKKIAEIVSKSGSRERTTILRTLPPGEVTPNSRPIFRVTFSSRKTVEEALAMAEEINATVPGWHVEPVYEPRSLASGRMSDQNIGGLRIHYMGDNDPAMLRNLSASSDSTTASEAEIIRLRTKAMIDKLSDLHRAKIINDSAFPTFGEAVTLGLEGAPNGRQAVDAFSDLRPGKQRRSRSVSGILASSAGLEHETERAGDLRDESPDGYSEGTDAIAERVEQVPDAVRREIRDSVNSILADDGPLPDEDESPVAFTMIRSGPSDADASRTYSSDDEVPLPPELSGEEPKGGILPTLRRFFGSSKDVPVIRFKKRGDLGMFRRWLAPLITSAWSSNNKTIRYVAEEIVGGDMERARVTEGVINRGRELFAQLPKEYRKENGKKFYALMDRYYDPNMPNSHGQWVDAEGNAIPDPVIDVLREFKNIDETQRIGIIRAKRDAVLEFVRHMKLARLISLANENGADWRVEMIQFGPLESDAQPFVMDDSTGDMMTVEEAKEAIVKVLVPDSWGRQYAHAFHAFFGSYEGIWYSKKAYRNAIRNGLSEEDALKSARRSVSMDGGTATSNTEAEMVRRLLRFRRNPPPGVEKDDIGRIEIKVQSYVPPDIVRVSGKQYTALRRHIENAADVEGHVVSEMLRGRIGKTEAKQRFYSPLLERTGKEGFDMDFFRAWSAQTAGYYKWLYFNKMRRNTTESIEQLRREGYVGWASHLQDTLDYTTSFRQSHFEQMLDGFITSIPVLRTMVGPMPTRRWLQMVRTVNVWRQLVTVRQQIVNSMQPLQTVFPIIGTQRFLGYIKRYNGREGKEVLSRYGYLRPDGTWYEGREFRLTSGTGWLSSVMDPIRKIGSKFGSESRNQNFTFFAFYTYAREQLGMEDNEAARHALLRVAQTQFAFSKANNPIAFRGPMRSTLLQYKRFMVSSFALVADNILMGRDARTGEKLKFRTKAAMFTRWLASFLAIGGLKGLPMFFVLDLLAKALPGEEEEKELRSGYDVYQGLREQLGENWANVIVMGLPAAAGVDISGSIVLFPKPYGRTAYEMLGNFAAGPTLSAFADVYRSLTQKDAVYQSGFRETISAIGASSPAIMQIGSAIDMISGDSEVYDMQGKLKFRRTTADQVRAMMGLRTIKESLESLEYNKIIVMREALDAYKDEIATLAASGMIVEMQQKIRHWNGMFPEMPLPYSMKALMKDPSIGRRIKRKIDDRTLDTRQRRMKQLNDELAGYLVNKYGMQEEPE